MVLALIDNRRDQLQVRTDQLGLMQLRSLKRKLANDCVSAFTANKVLRYTLHA
jgi:hypothetical protein